VTIIGGWLVRMLMAIKADRTPSVRQSVAT